MLKLLVIGANGQLGSEFRFLEKQYTHNKFEFVDFEELDITDVKSVQPFFASREFDAVINCAAYTAVDQAEDERAQAYLANEKGVKNLVGVCADRGMMLVHYSTDYVFNGKNYRPYVETDAIDPIGVYGSSKRAGEEAVLNSSITGVIIRTSWVYSNFGNNFVKTMLRLGKEREQLNVIFDQIGTPTNARDLANATMSILSKPEKLDGKQEVYHYSNEGVTSWYDFALAIFEATDINCSVSPILTKDYPTKAKRPHYSVLDKSKVKKTFELTIPHWKASLTRTLQEL